jgi:NADPH2:quinone reductase
MSKRNLVYVIKKSGENNCTLETQERDIVKPAQSEILIRHEYIGLNFYDVDVVRGIIKKKEEFVPGIEATGIIEALGSNLKQNFKIGERVAYCTSRLCGAYANYNIVHEDLVILLPDKVDSSVITGFLLRGMISHTLLKRVFQVDGLCTILLFNPIGALGHILTQWARHLGAKVIGIISSSDIEDKKISFERKKKLAEECGCDLVIDYDDSDFINKVMDFTNGLGIQVVYDSIGGDNLNKSISVLQYCGLFVSLGQNSGIPLKVSMQKVMEKSIFITRPSIFDYKNNANELRITALEIFNLLERQIIKPRINKIYDFNLKSILAAHQDLISRKSNFLNIFRV